MCKLICYARYRLILTEITYVMRTFQFHRFQLINACSLHPASPLIKIKTGVSVLCARCAVGVFIMVLSATKFYWNVVCVGF